MSLRMSEMRKITVSQISESDRMAATPCRRAIRSLCLLPVLFWSLFSEFEIEFMIDTIHWEKIMNPRIISRRAVARMIEPNIWVCEWVCAVYVCVVCTCETASKNTQLHQFLLKKRFCRLSNHTFNQNHRKSSHQCIKNA